LGTILALALNQKIKGISFFRTAIILPWTLSPVLIAITFSILYDPNQSGLINYILMHFHIIKDPVPWLGVGSAMPAVIVANTWFGTAFTTIIELAGLQSIPSDVYEAAKVDGASSAKTFFKITMPLLKPTILVNLIWITISTFNEFDLVYALTGGGPLKQTNLLGVYMYNTAFKAGKFEVGSSIAVLMFVTNALMTAVYTRLIKYKDNIL
jgi:multiple sugar transport system permease protein